MPQPQHNQTSTSTIGGNVETDDQGNSAYFDDKGDVVVTDPDGNLAEFIDTQGNDTTFNSDGGSTTLDADGNLKVLTYADGTATVFDDAGGAVNFDADGNPTSALDAAGNFSEVQYDPDTGVTVVTDEAGNQAISDSEGDVLATDPYGNPTEFIDSEGNDTTFSEDGSTITRDANGYVIGLTSGEDPYPGLSQAEFDDPVALGTSDDLLSGLLPDDPQDTDGFLPYDDDGNPDDPDPILADSVPQSVSNSLLDGLSSDAIASLEDLEITGGSADIEALTPDAGSGGDVFSTSSGFDAYADDGSGASATLDPGDAGSSSGDDTSGGGEDYSGGSGDYAGGGEDYAGGSGDYSGGGEDYSGGSGDYSGGGEDYSGGGESEPSYSGGGGGDDGSD